MDFKAIVLLFLLIGAILADRSLILDLSFVQASQKTNISILFHQSLESFSDLEAIPYVCTFSSGYVKSKYVKYKNEIITERNNTELQNHLQKWVMRVFIYQVQLSVMRILNTIIGPVHPTVNNILKLDNYSDAFDRHVNCFNPIVQVDFALFQEIKSINESYLLTALNFHEEKTKILMVAMDSLLILNALKEEKLSWIDLGTIVTIGITVFTTITSQIFTCLILNRKFKNEL